MLAMPGDVARGAPGDVARGASAAFSLPSSPAEFAVLDCSLLCSN